MNYEEFKQYLKEINIELNDIMLYQLEKYYEMLIEWNQKINLTAITNKKDVYLKHFYDSLTVNKVIDLKNEESLCDIGTGAGFPGLVLKICFPHLKLTLVDSLNKRLVFLKEVVKTLNLHDVEIIHARAEEYAKNNREKFDIVTARAVAPLNILLEYCIPLVKTGKYFIPLKGKENIDLYQNALNEISAKVEKIITFDLPIEKSIRTIIKIKKEKDTPLKYPRKNSEIKKNPL